MAVITGADILVDSFGHLRPVVEPGETLISLVTTKMTTDWTVMGIMKKKSTKRRSWDVESKTSRGVEV